MKPFQRFGVVSACAAAVGCQVHEIPPSPDAGLVVRVRGEKWIARPTGRFTLRDPLGTETPEGERAPTVSWAQDLDLDRPRHGVHQVDVAVMDVSDEGKLEGPRILIRRGRWKSDSVLGEDEDLGTLVIPAGSPVEAELRHELYAGGVCRQVEFESGLRVSWTGGAGITRNTTHAKFPQGTERRHHGGGLAWFELEPEYAPVSWAFVRGRVGGLYFPFAGLTIDAGADVGVRWGGVSLTAGYRLFRVQELTLGGPTFGVQIDF